MPDWLAKYGPVALVTGASSGIGAAFSRALAARGLDLALTARREDRLVRLAEDLQREYGVRVTVIVQDLAEPEAAEKIRSQTDALGLQIGLLVNNAGYGSYGELWKTDLERQRGMIAVHCRAVLDLTHAYVPAMVGRGRGGVIILSSVLGAMPALYMATYGATKAFDRSLGESLYGELKPHGVAVLAVLPTLTETEFQVGASLEKVSLIPRRTAEDVVRTSLRALGRRASVADGRLTAFSLQVMKCLPLKWVIAIYRRFRKPL